MQQYLIYAHDGTDDQAQARRAAARPQHFEQARALRDSNNFLMGGAMLNDQDQMIGSVMVVQFASREELQAWLDKEPYIGGRVWEKVEVTPFRMATL